MPPAVHPGRRLFRWGVIGVLLLAGAWRIVVAVTLPALSRDGVTLCWFARDLGQHGVACLRTPAEKQQPLYPALVLCTQRAARALGAPDTPLTWQRSGQIVAWLAGMAVVALTGVLASRLVRRLQLPLNERFTVLIAMALAALADLNIWLSADAMSDELHLAFYLAAILLLLKLNSAPAALGCGLLGGLAFLTRPEGLLPAAAGLLTLAAQRKSVRLPTLAARAVLLVAGFLLLAVPFWLVVGRLTIKKNPLEWLSETVSAERIQPETPEDPVCRLSTRPSHTSSGGIYAFSARQIGGWPHEPTGPPANPEHLAKLETFSGQWYALVPHALYQLFRAGRVMVLLLAALPLVNLRKRLLHPALIGLTGCLAGHFALTLVLLHHWKYLHPRHTLVDVLLLIPFAAMFVGRLVQLALERKRRGLAAAVLVGALLPFIYYGLRPPNAQDRFFVDAARWLVAHDPHVAGMPLLSGSSPKRVAFYADLRWEPWYERFEQPADYAELCGQLRAAAPGYFAIEVGTGRDNGQPHEWTGNRELVARLLADEPIKHWLKLVYQERRADGKTELYLFAVRSPGA